jgi:hypothetical protein
MARALATAAAAKTLKALATRYPKGIKTQAKSTRPTMPRMAKIPTLSVT